MERANAEARAGKCRGQARLAQLGCRECKTRPTTNVEQATEAVGVGSSGVRPRDLENPRGAQALRRRDTILALSEHR